MLDVREFIQRKDIGYAASFEPQDSEFIKKQQLLVNLGVLSPKEFFSQFERHYNDQTTPNFEPIQLGKSGNKLTNEGLTALAEMQVGKRQKIFGVYSIGEGTVSTNVRDTELVDEITRIDIIDNAGTILNRGSTTYYSVFFPKTISTITVGETAILDSLDSTSDVMLLRTVFPEADRVTHTINFDEIFVGHVIYSGSV
jgi:hypothetical protein